MFSVTATDSKSFSPIAAKLNETLGRPNVSPFSGGFAIYAVLVINTPLLPSTLCMGNGGPAKTVVTDKNATNSMTAFNPFVLDNFFIVQFSLETSISLLLCWPLY